MMQTSFSLLVGQRSIALPKPAVMGIINCSSLSFYQAIPDVSDALEKVREMVDAGVDIIDVGAVATNPTVDMSSDIPSVRAETDRVVPVISAIAKTFDVLISVDTCQPEVMAASVAAGAHIINDQRSLHEPGALEMAVKLQVPVCLMHHFDPVRLPDSTSLGALFLQIKSDLEKDVARCLAAGLKREQIIIDPGFGGGNFGKSANENFYVLSRLDELQSFGLPILAGVSRKSMFGELLNLPVEERLNASVAGATVAAMKGAAIIRAHDVKETVEAMRIIRKIYAFAGVSSSESLSSSENAVQ